MKKEIDSVSYNDLIFWGFFLLLLNFEKPAPPLACRFAAA
jgi:hypothetical protein